MVHLQDLPQQLSGLLLPQLVCLNSGHYLKNNNFLVSFGADYV